MKLSERATAGIGHNKPPERVCKCCGQELPSPRNAERHKLFFAILPKAFENWPTDYEEFQPLSTEHLGDYILDVGPKQADTSTGQGGNGATPDVEARCV